MPEKIKNTIRPRLAAQSGTEQTNVAHAKGLGPVDMDGPEHIILFHVI
jgi:hypothetical protein